MLKNIKPECDEHHRQPTEGIAKAEGSLPLFCNLSGDYIR